MNSNYLLDKEEPRVAFSPKLAEVLGLNEAIFLSQLQYWIRSKEEHEDNSTVRDGKVWIFNSYEQWREQLPFFSKNTLIRTINNLEEKGIVISGVFNAKRYDKRKWYTIDYQKLDEYEKPLPKMGKRHYPKWVDATTQNGYTNNKEYTYTTTMNTKTINGTSGDVLDSNPSDDYPQDVPDALGNDNHYSSVAAVGLSIQSGMTTISTNIERAKISANRLGLDTDTCDEVLKIIKYFLIKYQENRAEQHPVINQNVMDNVVESLTDGMIDASLELYADVIDDYFHQNLKCDYRLPHFVSGDVRKYRCYETYGNMLNLYDT